MVKVSMPAVLQGDRGDLEALAERDTDLDTLHGQIVQYLGKISTKELSDTQTQEVMNLFQAANYIEQIGDILETNMVKIGFSRIEEDVVISDQTKAVIERYHGKVMEALQSAVRAVREDDPDSALSVKDMKKTVADLAEETARHQISRLTAKEPNRLHTFTREMEVVENLSRIYRLCRKIARTEWLKHPQIAESAES
jgi:phosphate:Na+ symporter